MAFYYPGTARGTRSTTELIQVWLEGDKDRDREETARRFFDEHGRWPDEPESVDRRRG